MKTDNIFVNYHSSICLGGNIFIDPLNVKGEKKADLIFITHPHWDHLDKVSIQNLKTEKTLFVCPKDATPSLLDIGVEKNKIREVEPNEEFEILGMKVRTFPAYNKTKAFHPRKNNWVGYEISLGGVKYLVCGDTDSTPELESLSADIMFVPIGGTYTMDSREAAELVNKIMPKVVIPIHYGSIVGNKASEKDFVSRLNKKIQCDKKL